MRKIDVPERWAVQRLKVNGVVRNLVFPDRRFTPVQTELVFDPNNSGWITFNVDSPDSPGVPVAEMSLRGTALDHIRRGGAVITGGSRFEKA